MTFIRPVEKKDSDRIIDFAFKSQLGITSLPKNRQALIEKVEQSIESFKKQVETPGPERYLFALEDSEGRLVGISGIKADTSIDHPLATYHIEHENDYFWLIPSYKYSHLTEISSLFVDHDLRQQGAGRLLSYSRFLFMADFPERFHDQVFANMRGVIHDSRSIFWETVTGRFLNLPFAEVMKRIDHGEMDYEELIPTHPICSLFLPKETLEVIGKTHPHTRGAQKLLEKEGFVFKHVIDMIDGGPVLHGKHSRIKTIKESRISTIASFGEGPTPYLISNGKVDFRAALANATLTPDGVTLPKQTAESLHLNLGDTLRLSPLKEHT